MIHLSSAEATIIAGAMGTTGYVLLMRKQKPMREATMDSNDRLQRIEHHVDGLLDKLDSHTVDDAANFRELRQAIRRPSRRRRWLLPALALVVKLFLH